MRKVNVPIICLVLTICLSPRAVFSENVATSESAEQNLITAGGFEQVEDNKPAGWICRDSGSETVEFTSSAEKPKEGKYCLQVKGNADWAAAISEFVPINAKEKYTLTAFVRVKRGEANLVCEYFRDSEYIARTSSKMARLIRATDEWQEIFLVTELDRYPDATQLRATVMAVGDVELWIDALSLRKGASAAALAPKDKRIRLQPGIATRFTGDAAITRDQAVGFPRPLSLWLNWSDSGSVTWQVTTERADEYEIALCYACCVDGPRATVELGDKKIGGSLRKTQGLYKDPWDNSYENLRLNGNLRLPAGTSTLTLRIETGSEADSKSDGKEFMRLHTVELTPLSAKAALDAATARAIKARAGTDWFVKAGYGIMTHWTSRTCPKEGQKKPYHTAVEEFNVAAFAGVAEESGAGFVMFTLHHGDHTCPAPIKSWEDLHPGSTTQRDLIGELADALNARGIKLMLYMSPNSIGKEGSDLAFWSEENWPFLPEEGGEDFFAGHERVFTELGKRYGDKLMGYWFDGIMQIYLKYPQYPFERMFKALKTGCPDRLIAWNSWVMPNCTPWQEYWTGEGFGPGQPALPTSRYLTGDTGLGVQAHGLFILDDDWGHFEKDKPIKAPLYTEEKLIGFVKACVAKECVATINIATYQDGSVSPATLQQLKNLRKAIRGK